MGTGTDPTRKYPGEFTEDAAKSNAGDTKLSHPIFSRIKPDGDGNTPIPA